MLLFVIIIMCCIASAEKETELWFQWPELYGDKSVEIHLESHFKPPPNVVWIKFAKITFHVVFCCPDFLKSIWIQSAYAKKQIWAGSLNKALETRQFRLLPKTLLHSYGVASIWTKVFASHSVGEFFRRQKSNCVSSNCCSFFISTWPQLAIVFAGSPEMSLHGEDKP